MDRLFLLTLLLAEITRFQKGKEGFSLTNPKIEKVARMRFAKARNFDPKSKPEKFIRELGGVYEENGMLETFKEKLIRFKLNPEDFKPIIVK